jgi:hypothetical protein
MNIKLTTQGVEYVRLGLNKGRASETIRQSDQPWERSSGKQVFKIINT